jgi:PAS domain S-box-containing protein
VFDFLTHLFDTTGFPDRWNCGNWTPAHGWLHIFSDLAVWSAYFAIPCILAYFLLRRRDVPFPTIFWLFGAFILACGTTHLMEAIIFWHPVYRLAGLIKLITAVVSWGTVAALVPTIPKALAMRTPGELEREIAARTQAEKALQQANADLEMRVEERTADLAKANASLAGDAARIASVVNHVIDGIIAIDENGIIEAFNPAAAKLFGYQTGEVIGQNVKLLMPEPFHGEHDGYLANYRRTGQAKIIGIGREVVGRRKDGSTFPMDLGVSEFWLSKRRYFTGIVRDITDRKNAEATIKQLNTQLADDLESMTRLQELSGRMVQAGDFSLLLEEILNAAIAITASDMGNIQLVEGDALKIVAQRGFDGSFLDFFNSVHGGQAACGTALQNRGRIIVEDVASSPIFAGTPALHVLLTAKVRAVQSTPLVSRSGRVLGMFSTHYQTRRRPTERELRMLDLLARLAADMIESKQADETLRESEIALRQSSNALQAKEAELELVMSRTPLLLTRCSRDLRYTFVNRACADFLGRPAKEIIGRPIVEVMGEPAFAAIKPHVELVLRGEAVEFESNIPYAGARQRFMRVLYTPDRDEQGQVIGWVATISDITERKQLEREREERAAELAVALGKRTEEARRAEKAELLLREADSRKDEFLATLAHELRNPLAPLRNAVELLRRADDDKALMEQARSVMERQVSQLVRLVDDLLDIARITKGKLQLRLERVELAEVLNSAIESARPLIDALSHELTVTIPPQPMHVQADQTRLAQVFLNLLNNAAKYTDKAGHIWLTAERRGNEAVVSVRDTGIGIAAEHMPHVFTMFSQVESALERSQGGLGIGLSLVEGLVELHGGAVEARSGGPGKGSEFTVRLPIVGLPEQAPQESSAAGEKSRGGPKCRILVVDDLRDAANSLAMMLRMMGHETRTAYDGLEAVQTAAIFQPHVVLLDIGLPKLNGYEAARTIRNESWGGNVALVALTGWGQEEDKRRSLEAGFDHHLTKPVDPAALEKLLALTNPLQ